MDGTKFPASREMPIGLQPPTHRPEVGTCGLYGHEIAGKLPYVRTEALARVVLAGHIGSHLERLILRRSTLELALPAPRLLHASSA